MIAILARNDNTQIEGGTPKGVEIKGYLIQSTFQGH